MPPSSCSVIERIAVDQMVLVKMPFSAGSVPTVRLDASDVPDTLALGPFGPRTIELGQHVGVRTQGMLFVMARERMQLDGFTEISAVCVRPPCRGQGLAAELVRMLARPRSGAYRSREGRPRRSLFRHWWDHGSRSSTCGTCPPNSYRDGGPTRAAPCRLISPTLLKLLHRADRPPSHRMHPYH
jgi:hypothetical protein